MHTEVAALSFPAWVAALAAHSLEMYFSGSARKELASAGVFSSKPSNSELQQRATKGAGSSEVIHFGTSALIILSVKREASARQAGG